MGKVEKLNSIAYRTIDYRDSLKESSIGYRTIDYSEDKQERVSRIVDEIERKLGHPESRMFYRKCAWHMSEDEIFSRIEQAQRPTIRNSLAYFISSSNKLLKKRGY